MDFSSVTNTENVAAFNLTPLPSQHRAQRMHDAAREFESLFMSQLMKEFDRTVSYEDNILYSGHAEDMFRGLFNQEMGRVIASSGGIGLADMIEQDTRTNE